MISDKEKQIRLVMDNNTKIEEASLPCKLGEISGWIVGFFIFSFIFTFMVSKKIMDSPIDFINPTVIMCFFYILRKSYFNLKT